MEPISFGIDDLKFVKAMIEKLNGRAAFQPDEMANVGTLYNRLTAFIGAAEASIQQQKADAHQPGRHANLPATLVPEGPHAEQIEHSHKNGHSVKHQG